LVEIRIGDARTTLARDLPEHVDLLFLDGAKVYYSDVLGLVEPRLSPDVIICCNNAEMQSAQAFIAHVKASAGPYVCAEIFTSAIGTHFGHLLITRRG
jgi:predicted O-methyltransferase YrrM